MSLTEEVAKEVVATTINTVLNTIAEEEEDISVNATAQKIDETNTNATLDKNSTITQNVESEDMIQPGITNDDEESNVSLVQLYMDEQEKTMQDAPLAEDSIDTDIILSELSATKDKLLAVMTELEIYKKREEDLEREQTKKLVEKRKNIPDIIIIVPYRDRASQRSAFIKIMPEILRGKNYEIYFAHQRDSRPFNRGAMKNLGFLYVKRKYGVHCKNITIVFHDIDVMPWHQKQFSYQTRHNVVNHFYGFEQALGGIVAIKAVDFDKLNGFPNIWTWGLEDNVLQMRCIKNNVRISRNEFVNIHKNNKNIISLWHGWDRLISPNIEPKWKHDNGRDGIRSLRNITMNCQELNDNFLELNITSFETGEPLSSPFVRGAKMRNARFHVRQNEPLAPPRLIKRGNATTFGRGYGLKRMLMNSL